MPSMCKKSDLPTRIRAGLWLAFHPPLDVRTGLGSGDALFPWLPHHRQSRPQKRQRLTRHLRFIFGDQSTRNLSALPANSPAPFSAFGPRPSW